MDQGKFQCNSKLFAFKWVTFILQPLLCLKGGLCAHKGQVDIEFWKSSHMAYTDLEKEIKKLPILPAETVLSTKMLTL